MKKSIETAVENYINGNHSDVAAWAKKASKLDILDSIEYAVNGFVQRHIWINYLRNILDK